MISNTPCYGFLLKHKLLASQYDVKEILNSFLEEMEKGLAGTESSLAMISSYISIPETAPKNKKIIALDAGGTNFRTTLIKFDEESNPHIEYFTNNPMPGMERQFSKEEFFNKIVEYIQPVLKESDRLGFCFSYPAVIDQQRDGTLLYWTKEVNAPEVVGEKILANLTKTLQQRSLPCPKSMVILNDTVASLLAGVTATQFSKEYNYIGFILGTGSNTSYLETNRNIKKEKGLVLNQYQAINVESANFNKFERGDIDQAFDQTTANPGKYILEKMISGGYLGNLCYKILLTAAEEGLLSSATSQKLLKLENLSTPFLSNIVSDSLNQQTCFDGCPDNDLLIIKSIITETVDRAALLTAINIAAAIFKSAKSSDTKKYCVAADGSVYYKLYSFRERAEKYLDEILKTSGIEYKTIQIDDAPIIGSAVAGAAI